MFLFPSRHYVVYYFFVVIFIYLVPWDTSAQAGSIQLHVERETSTSSSTTAPHLSGGRV